MDPGKGITVQLNSQEFFLWISEVVKDMDWLLKRASQKLLLLQVYKVLNA